MSLNKLVNPYLQQYIFSDYIEYLNLQILNEIKKKYYTII